MSSWSLSQHFHYNGYTVRWDKTGQGPPVILVHGTPWSSFNLRHLVRGLSSRFEVYFYDLAGYGQSDKPDADVSLGIQNEILSQLTDHWNLENPIAIGHDFGGATVLRTHLLNRRSFEKMVLIDPVALSPWGSPFFRHVQKHLEAFTGLPDFIHEAVVTAYIQTAAFHPIPADTLKAVIAPWTGDDGKAGFYRQIAQADSRYTDEIQHQYKTIDTPTLILWGEEDAWISVEKGHQLQRMIPRSGLRTIPGSGHLVIEENPDILNAHIMAFLSED